jgi:hypothetical protein
MNTTRIKPQSRRTTKLGWLVAASLAIGGITWYSGAWDHLSPKSETQQRGDIYARSVSEVAKQSATWPRTEPALLQEFWKSVASKNFKQAVIFCPGSKESDFAPYTKMPSRENVTVGDPEQHPSAAGVKLWPMKVVFEGFGPKTIKLAVNRLPNGQLAIDGQHSIWW